MWDSDRTSKNSWAFDMMLFALTRLSAFFFRAPPTPSQRPFLWPLSSHTQTQLIPKREVAIVFSPFRIVR